MVRLALAVADHVPFHDRDQITRAGHDALDEVRARALGFRLRARGTGRSHHPAHLLLRAPRRVEDGYLAHVRIAEVHADAIDEHPLADRQGRLHRAAGDAIGLDDPLLDAEREAHGHGDDHDELDDRARGRARALRADPHARSSAA